MDPQVNLRFRIRSLDDLLLPSADLHRGSRLRAGIGQRIDDISEGLSPDAPLELVLIVEDEAWQEGDLLELKEAIQSYFSYQRQRMRGKRARTIRRG